MARSFDGGTSTKLVCSGTAVPTLTGNWTVGCWLKRSGVSGSGSNGIWERWTNTTTARELFIYFNSSVAASPNTIQVDIPFLKAILTSTATITDQNWHTVVVTKAGTVWTIYIDGLQDSTVTDATAQETGPPSVALFSNPTLFGLGFAGGQLTFAGDGAHMFACNAALTAAEVWKFYSGRLPPTIRPQNLVGYWPMKETGGAAIDVGPYSAHGLTSSTPAPGQWYEPPLVKSIYNSIRFMEWSIVGAASPPPIIAPILMGTSQLIRRISMVGY
jgi:hypothetical protein